MTAQTAEIPAEFFCDRCGYDLRAHPEDGKCPECGMLVVESQRLAAYPRRPAWRNSDPRWRRRMLVGIWLLVLLPLMDVLIATGWAARISLPNVFNLPVSLQLDETFLANFHVYTSLIFCVGIALLFSKEKGRRRNRMDWTRRWGVICTYVVFLLCAVPIVFITALVLVGIAALFLSMPPKYQPAVTQWFVQVGTGYLRHGPYPKEISVVVLAAFSSITMLLACLPLFDALRSTAAKRYALIPLALLAFFSLMYLVQAFQFSVGTSNYTAANIVNYGVYFWPELLVGQFAGLPPNLSLSGSPFFAFLLEAAKWCAVLGIAVWLSVAHFAAWRQRKKLAAGLTPLAAGIG
jgi:hypothetical protein